MPKSFSRPALDELLKAAGLPMPPAGELELTGEDPVFPTRYRIAAAGTASTAAVALAANALWEQRTGRRQRVTVDARAAAASLRSSRYMRINGKPLPGPFDPLSGYYPVQDGWVLFHCNFPKHKEAALSVLGAGAGLEPDPAREAMKAASARWQGVALEDALHAAGGCAAYVRTPEVWAAHPHAQAVAQQPLLEIERIGDALPEALPPGTADGRPLSGVRVLDLTRVLAGPTCARTLAEHGADVLKITAEHLPDNGLLELDTGLGKLSARLDLREESARARLRDLVREGDVFSQSYRPGTLAARGFSPQELARLRPGLVYVTLSAWGASGPWQGRRGFDTIVQSASGMAHVSGTASKPALLPVSAIDYVTGHLMALGALAALRRRAAEGGSWLVRVSLARTGRWIVERGLLEPAQLAGVPDELAADEIERLCTTLMAPDGEIRHLKPVAQLSETPARWARPPVPLGHHPAEWPARG